MILALWILIGLVCFGLSLAFIGDDEDWYLVLGTWFWGIVIATILAGVINTATTDTYDTKSAYTSETSLKAISSVMQTEGSYSQVFFVATGSVGQKPVYYYYYETDNGGFKVGSVSAYNATVFEDANPGTARLVYNCTHYESNGSWVNYPFHPHDEWNQCDDEVEIHVPPGTIVSNIDISLPEDN